MAKKKRQKLTDEQIDDICDLAVWAGKFPVPNDILEGELQDACTLDARQAFENISQAVLLDKLEFLYMRGWTIPRLRELIEEELKGEG